MLWEIERQRRSSSGIEKEFLTTKNDGNKIPDA